MECITEKPWLSKINNSKSQRRTVVPRGTILLIGGYMEALIGCEESQKVCRAFRDLGIEAFSCDLQKTRGNTKWHYQEDIMRIIPRRRWGIIILHPDCTAMSVSGNGTYGLNNDGTPKPKHYKRIEAIDWTIKLWNLAKQHSDNVVLENPNSVIFPHLRKLGAIVQYIQPWQFGHGETKRTGLALHGVDKLIPTNIVEGREQRIWKMAPGENRKRDRSETYDGIAEAMAEQWSKYCRT